MKNKFEYLEILPIVLEKITQIEKKINGEIQWLDINEASKHTGYSKESIRNMIKSGEFIKGIHFHQKIKKLIFNKYELDKWIMNDTSKNYIDFNLDEKIEEILSSINT